MATVPPCGSVLFDTGPLGTGSCFQQPERIIEAWQPQDVPGAFEAMEEARANGLWLAGSMSYELGYVLIPKLTPRLPSERHEPLLRFGVFTQVAPPEPISQHGPASLGPLDPAWDLDTYEKAFDAVRKYLQNGDIYQANLTFPISLPVKGSLHALYDILRQRQPVPYGALVDLGETTLLSRSPELFFSLSSTGALRARPMKGTSKRSDDPAEDTALKVQLEGSVKNRAENLMITDLLRNDFGRIAKIGSVRVPKLFAVESYATVHQMTSDVTAQILPEYNLTDIFTALFPCGSITGAPKIRAMEIIEELEDTPRGSYCGAIGWIAPNGAMAFNVAIRTLICTASDKVTLNVGGGIVYDSTASSEYEEALLKAQFTQQLS
ncbi:aminodeoxychorismate synthase component I [Yoonia sediminilitoris]|uniref:Aminodeoxychorismate synthase subunit I n=1 Tax=Yoonia sediminilitoris TaxID=1286148 RepID=A0A2T6KHB3_9RHOB|nr:aminodeoxychorismate synthase component I [Yoonia sediminilitoris]PUB14906.1 aminodeoxychorismate synthase subunit I [Yoonia sediminilitoris]RCW95623.1 aminodeoxychorismate synthase subunit I [Yoonia sediminilitoris]